MSCCRRRPSFQPVQFVYLRCIGPVLTVITAPATWVVLPDTIGGCVDVLHCLMFGVSVHDTNSKGFVLLSLRCSWLLSSSWIASTLLWWRSLSPCFLANRLISAITIYILRSLWRPVFRMYQGALTVSLRTLFWNLCIMAMLLGFVHPHSCMP